MRNLIRTVLVTYAILFIMNSLPAHSCTGIKVQSKDGATIFARTLEFGTPLKSDILFVPRGQTWTSPAPDNQKGMTWQNKYAYLGPNAFDEKMLIGGINEKGLYIGGFWFPNIAEYPAPVGKDTSRIVDPSMISSLILGTCSTIEEAQNKIKEIEIVGVEFKPLGKVLPMHWIVMDNKGNAIVIEPINGKIVVLNNTVGVFTNSPPFEWHLQNLSNYINLTADNSDPKKLNGYNTTPIGEGTGMLGLPGDVTPPSRFVRAAFFSNASTPMQTADEALNQALMLISNISIAKGLVKNSSSVADYTQWTAVYDLKRRRCYVRTYSNQDIRVVHLDNLPKDGKKILSIPMWNTKPKYEDITGQAK